MAMIYSPDGLTRRGRFAAGALAVVLSCVLGWGAGAPAQAAGLPHHPVASRATVLEVQRLFRVLGYPLGSKAPGGLGVRTRGAISYFQHKYGLPVTGYPDARTIAVMRTVAAALRSSTSLAETSPHDLVERTLGDHTPIFPIAAALTILLAALALTPRLRSSQDSRSTDAMRVEPEES